MYVHTARQARPGQVRPGQAAPHVVGVMCKQRCTNHIRGSALDTTMEDTCDCAYVTVVGKV